MQQFSLKLPTGFAWRWALAALTGCFCSCASVSTGRFVRFFPTFPLTCPLDAGDPKRVATLSIAPSCNGGLMGFEMFEMLVECPTHPSRPRTALTGFVSESQVKFLNVWALCYPSLPQPNQVLISIYQAWKLQVGKT